mgnify:CR=1 FL=1
MPDKLVLPLHDPFSCQPFWNRAHPCVFELGSYVPVPSFPCPPVVAVDVPGAYGRRGVEAVPIEKVPDALGARNNHPMVAHFKSLKILKDLEWIFGVKIPNWVHDSSSYDDLTSNYNKFALQLLHQLVGQAPRVMPYDDAVALTLYRARRCFPPLARGEDGLDFLQRYATPLSENVYTQDEVLFLMKTPFERRGIIPGKIPFQASFSIKATMEYTRKERGFNSSVEALSQYGSHDLFPIPPVFGIDMYFGNDIPLTRGNCSNYGLDIAANSRRDKVIFAKALSGALAIMRAIKGKRNPMCHVSILYERSGKRRIPTLAEGFSSILSKYVSRLGKIIQARLFPLTKGNSVKIRAVESGLYLSGDYAASTDWISWDVCIASYYMMFKYAGFSVEEMDLHMEIVKFLIGPHDFYSSNDERKRYRSIFAKFCKMPVGQEPFRKKFGFSVAQYCQKNGCIAPIVHHQEAEGSRFGRLGPLREDYPSFAEIIEGLSNFSLGVLVRTITSVRGLPMCYSIAAPALHIVGAIPHWAFPGLEFEITGDDNVSTHGGLRYRSKRDNPEKALKRAQESIDILEKEKRRTGMVPHDKQKSARGPRGCLLAERLFVLPHNFMHGKVRKRRIRKKNPEFQNLEEVKNFPVRILFPQEESEWHGLTMPAAAYKNLNEVDCELTRLRIIGYVYWKYKSFYDELEKLNISIGGPNGLFGHLRHNLGALNYEGGFSLDKLTAKPSSVSLADVELVLALISEKVSVLFSGQETSDVEEQSEEDLTDLFVERSDHSSDDEYEYNGNVDLDSVCKISWRTDTFLDMDEARKRVSFLPPVSHYKFRPPPNPCINVIEIIRDNIRKLTEVRIEKHHLDRRVGPAPHYSVNFVERVPHERVCHSQVDFADKRRIEYYRDNISFPISMPITHMLNSGQYCVPAGLTLTRLLEIYQNVWFIDMANLIPSYFREFRDFTFREVELHFGYKVTQILSNLHRPRNRNGFNKPLDNTMVVFIQEKPRGMYMQGNFEMFDLGLSPLFPIITNVITGPTSLAGADQEFRQLVNIIKRTQGARHNLFYTSNDSDWRKFAVKCSVTHLRIK